MPCLEGSLSRQRLIYEIKCLILQIKLFKFEIHQQSAKGLHLLINQDSFQE